MNPSQLIAPFAGADFDQPTKRHGPCRLSFAVDGKLGLFIPPRKM
jgi:hypothetical protein